MFLKQIFAREEKKYASFKNIEFPRGNYQTDSSENTLLSLLFTTKFSSAHWFKNQLHYFRLLEMKAVKAKLDI